MNHYEILEVSPNASPEVVRAAYKSLMQRYHPDRQPGAGKAEQAILIAQAYEVLSDPGRRAAYDLELKQLAAGLQDTLGKRVDAVLSRPSPAVKNNESSWYLWLLLIVAILIGWSYWPFAKNQPFIASTIKEANFQPERNQTANDQTAVQHTNDSQSIEDNSDAQESNADKSLKELESRTIRTYVKDLKVKLKASENSSRSLEIHTLSIPRMSVIVGAFESDKFIRHLSDNEDFISRNLAERLAGAEYNELIKNPQGEDYLKRFILDTFGEITGADRYKAHPAPNGKDPEYYGVVNVLLPESYTVQ